MNFSTQDHLHLLYQVIQQKLKNPPVPPPTEEWAEISSI